MDPIYPQGWEQEARRSGGLFEENLKPWADAMMEGQFNAGMMAQLDALRMLNGLDLAPFNGLQRIARNCCWWWAFDVGAMLESGLGGEGLAEVGKPSAVSGHPG